MGVQTAVWGLTSFLPVGWGEMGGGVGYLAPPCSDLAMRDCLELTFACSPVNLIVHASAGKICNTVCAAPARQIAGRAYLSRGWGRRGNWVARRKSWTLRFCGG